MEEQPDIFLNLSQSADYLGISAVTMRSRVRNGEIKTVTDPADHRQKLISKKELDRLKFPKALAATLVVIM